MELVHFTRYDGIGSISFVADKIVAFTAFNKDESKTSIFVVSACDEHEEFVVGENYRQVVAIMEKI